MEAIVSSDHRHRMKGVAPAVVGWLRPRTVGVDAAPEFIPKRNSEPIVTAAGSPATRRVSRLANARCGQLAPRTPAPVSTRYLCNRCLQASAAATRYLLQVVRSDRDGLGRLLVRRGVGGVSDRHRVLLDRRPSASLGAA